MSASFGNNDSFFSFGLEDEVRDEREDGSLSPDLGFRTPPSGRDNPTEDNAEDDVGEEFSDISPSRGLNEFYEDDNISLTDDTVFSWRVQHSSGDHKLKARDFIEKVESSTFDGTQALEMLHRRYTMDYGSRRSGSKCPDITDQYHPLFFLDYISIIGRPLQPLTQMNDQFFENVTVTFKYWQKPYSAKHQSKLNFDLQYRTFHIATASTREAWFIVMHPIVAPSIEIPSRTEHIRRLAKSSQHSALHTHHAEALFSYIKQIFQSGELVGERIEESWSLNGSLSQQLTSNKWSSFQQQFMADWTEHLERYAHDPFWTQNQPVFHAYDYGANIPIAVQTGINALGKETRLRPEDDDSSDSSSSSSSIDSNEEARVLLTPTPETPRSDWAFTSDMNQTDYLYSGGLRTLMNELEERYDLENISSISYALAVDLHCAQAASYSQEEEVTALCMLADQNLVRREYPLARGLTFYPLALHPAYGNFTSAGPPKFLKDHVLTVMQDNMSFQNHGADVLSCEYFQGYSNIKRSIRYNPEDLLVTQGTATAALSLPVAETYRSRSIQTKQQNLLGRLEGARSPDYPQASKPFARERMRIQQAVEDSEFAFRMEQVVSINVANLIPSRRHFRTILRPIFQLMRFYLHETEHYIHILRCFQPAIFPRILGSFARLFEVAIDEMLVRFRAQKSAGLGVALSEGVAALDRLGNYCFTGSQQALMPSVMKPLRTMDSLQRGGWPYLDPQILDLRYGEGTLDFIAWPRSANRRPLLLHLASLSFHYGPEVAASRQNIVWFRDVGGKHIPGPTAAFKFLDELFRDLWIPQMVSFVQQQSRRSRSYSSTEQLPERLASLETWSRTPSPFSWSTYEPIWMLNQPQPAHTFLSTKSRQDFTEELYSVCFQDDQTARKALVPRHATWFAVLHAVLSHTDLATISRTQWVEAISAALIANGIECMPGSHKASIAHRHAVRIVGRSPLARDIRARPGSLKRAAIEAEHRAGQVPRPQRIDFRCEIPFVRIPTTVANGFEAQGKILAKGNQKILEHYFVARNCLERHLSDPLCELLLVFVLTLSASSVTPTVSPSSDTFEDGPRRDPRIFAASLATRMLWFLYPTEFPWDKDDGSVLCISEMTKKVEHKGVGNRLLRAMGWVVSTSQRPNPRNSELRLRPRDELLALRRELLALFRDPPGFLASIFHSQNHVWVERCDSIITDQPKRRREGSSSRSFSTPSRSEG